MTLEGGCACGAIRYRLTADPTDASYCHCTTCRRSAGAPVQAFASVPREAFELLQGEPSRWRSSEQSERMFCGSCGTQLAMVAPDHPEIDFTLASLDQPEAVPPGFHIWTRSQIGWFEVKDDLPRHLRRSVDD